ncbi:MAG TPA: lysophospholipid acyltransferase family protein [Lacunisphaera sp.]|nr:lysophospholipid acyltransferase family protein [Lacunisphaera sp.]
MLVIYQLPAYYFTLLLFALGGLELSALSLLFGWLPATQATERFFQRLIHGHFKFFHWWCDLLHLVHVRYEGLERLPPSGVVIVANHLSLIDITCLLARIPEAICIFKPAIRRNPVLGAAARRAGYLGGDGGHDLVRAAAAKVAAGDRLIVFPEGTRTPDGNLQAFKPGFVLIARRARAPVQVIRITTDSDVLTKGARIVRLPRFPASVVVSVGPLVATDTPATPAELSAAVEEWFRSGRDPATPAASPALS